MSDKNDGGPAFPFHIKATDAFTDEEITLKNDGMSLRDWFAGMAIQGLLSHPEGGDAGRYTEVAYELADAMLEARAKNDSV